MKKRTLLPILAISLIILAGIAISITKTDLVNAFSNIQDIDLIIDDDFGTLKLRFACADGTNVTGGICPGFIPIMDIINQTHKLSFSKFFLTFGIESLNPSLPIITIKETFYTINPFELKFGPISFKSNESGTITDFVNILNVNSIQHNTTTVCTGGNGNFTGCFAVTPGFWKNRICDGRPHTVPDSQLNTFLATIRANSQFFLGLNTREDACTILSTNNPLRERAEKFFLANMFSFAAGGLNLTIAVDSKFGNATTFGEVIDFSDNVLLNNIKKDYQKVGSLNEDIAAFDATQCIHEFQDVAVV